MLCLLRVGISAGWVRACQAGEFALIVGRAMTRQILRDALVINGRTPDMFETFGNASIDNRQILSYLRTAAHNDGWRSTIKARGQSRRMSSVPTSAASTSLTQHFLTTFYHSHYDHRHHHASQPSRMDRDAQGQASGCQRRAIHPSRSQRNSHQERCFSA